ncbi:MAG TPA: hypothetical protein VIL37_08160 [Natronosporangium sp.]
MKQSGLLVTALAGLLMLAGCAGGDGNGEGTEPAPAPTGPTVSSPPADGMGGGAPPPGPPHHPRRTHGPEHWTSDWTSGPTTVTRNLTVPPMPQLVRIRSAAHPDAGYDRIVFDFTGPLPGYQIRYVDEVRQDPSDLPVDLPGRRFLLVVFTPAQAHTDDGTSLISPGRKTLDYPMMRGFALAGDFEGHVSIGIGLDDVVGYRVGELPGRIYLDVAA